MHHRSQLLHVLRQILSPEAPWLPKDCMASAAGPIGTLRVERADRAAHLVLSDGDLSDADVGPHGSRRLAGTRG